MFRLFAAVFAACALLAAPAFAQSAPTPRQLELSRQYVALMQGDQMEALIRELMATDPTMDLSDVPAEDREFLLDLTAQLVSDLMPRIMEEMVPVYAAVFTEAELEALVGFYGTEMGRSIVAKSMEVMPEVNLAMAALIPDLFEKMANRLCAHYGCDAREALAEMYAGAGMAPPPGSAPARARSK